MKNIDVKGKISELKALLAKNHRDSNIVVLFLVVLLVLGGVIYLLTKSNDNSAQVTNCADHVAQANKLFSDGKPQDAYGLMIPHESACGVVPTDEVIADETKTNETAAILEFNGFLAKSAFLNKQDQQAKKYAKNAQTIIQKLKPAQRDSLAVANTLSIDMHQINEGTYSFHALKKKISPEQGQ